MVHSLRMIPSGVGRITSVCILWAKASDVPTPDYKENRECNTVMSQEEKRRGCIWKDVMTTTELRTCPGSLFCFDFKQLHWGVIDIVVHI